MPKTEITKDQILISIDKELKSRLKLRNIKVSTLINHLMWKFLVKETEFSTKASTAGFESLLKCVNISKTTERRRSRSDSAMGQIRL